MAAPPKLAVVHYHKVLLSDDTEAKVHKSEFGKRHWIIILGFFGSFNIYVLRANLSLAIVAMVVSLPITTNSYSNSTSSNLTDLSSDVCEKPTTENGLFNGSYSTRNSVSYDG